MFSANNLIDNEDKVKAVNAFAETQSPAFCDRCYQHLYEKYRDEWQRQYKQAKEYFATLLPNIPVITLQNPKDWNYSVLRMVTAQSVTGTGVISELSSSFSDLFGLQSNMLNSKLKNGENICRLELRMEAFKIGGNAIIGTDIDYAEVGGDKGMLMVCMAGTAIKLKNPEVLELAAPEKLEALIKVNEIIIRLKDYEKIYG